MIIKNKSKGITYAILSAMCYGLIGYFGMSIINTGVSVENMSFWRFFVATIFVGLFVLPKIKNLGKTKDIIKLFIYGGTTYAFTGVTYFYASEYIGTGLAIVIFFTFPIFVSIINFFFYKINITKLYMISMSLIVIGMLFLVELENLAVDLIGIGISILAAISYAIHVVTSKQIRLPSTIATFLIMLGSTIICGVMALANGTLVIPRNEEFIINILGLSILSTVIPVVLLLEGMRHISALKASIVSVFEPVLVLTVGVVLLHEEVSLYQIIGAGIILSGAVVAMIDPNLLKRITSRAKPKPTII